MWDAVKGILGSKKALMALLSLVVWVVGKLGADLDAETLLPAVAPLWAYVFGQGLSDIGKEKAKLESADGEILR